MTTLYPAAVIINEVLKSLNIGEEDIASMSTDTTTSDFDLHTPLPTMMDTEDQEQYTTSTTIPTSTTTIPQTTTPTTSSSTTTKILPTASHAPLGETTTRQSQGPQPSDTLQQEATSHRFF